MGLVARMVGAAWSTTTRIVLVVLLVASLAVNVASFTVNTVSMAIGTLIEAVTGAETVMSKFRKQETKLAEKTMAASKWEGTAAGRAATVGKLETEKKVIQSELSAARKLASRAEGRAIGKALALDKVVIEVAELKAARTVEIDGAKMAVEDAAATISRRVKTRTAKVATADVAATFGQSLPWIGVAVVVSATAYDLKVSCENMRDVHTLEVALNPSAANDPSVDEVCGMKVPTKEEVWEAIKASPGAAWDKAGEVLEGLPPMPSVDWPTMPDVDWKFWD